MKIKILLLLALILFISCGIEDAGPSDCAKYYDDYYIDRDVQYQYDMMHVVDSEGLSNSCEACIIKRGITNEYKQDLEQEKSSLNAATDGCTDEERINILDRFNGRIGELEYSLEIVYDRCEEIYQDCD